MSNSLCFKGEIPATRAFLQQIASSSVLAGEDTERSTADLGLLLWLQRRKNAHSLLIIWACKESISLSKYLKCTAYRAIKVSAFAVRRHICKVANSAGEKKRHQLPLELKAIQYGLPLCVYRLCFHYILWLMPWTGWMIFCQKLICIFLFLYPP